MKPKLMLSSAIYLTLYLIGGTLYYVLAAGDMGERFPIFAALYALFVAIHAGIVLVAVLCQWWGYFGNRRGPVFVSVLLCIVAGIELALLVYPMVGMLVAVVLGLIATRQPKTAR
ncbi:MAG: hypothetical protein WC509_03980 [Candidatus Izemoplasmatales bacterium]